MTDDDRKIMLLAAAETNKDLPEWMICRFLPDTTLTFVNDVYCRVFNKSADELIGKQFIDHFPTGDRSDILDRINNALAENIISRHEYKVIYSDGSKGWQEWTDYPMIDDKGIARELQSVGLDITRRKQAEVQLKESEERYRQLFEHSPLGVFHYDINGVIVDCNDYFVKIAGSSRESLIGMNILSLPDQKIVREAEKTLKGEMGFYEDSYHSTTTEKVTPVRVYFAPVKGEEGQVIGCVGIVEDITAQKKNENALQQSELRFHRMLSLVPDMISIQDPEMNIVYSNWRGLGDVPEENRILGAKCYEVYRGYDGICRDCHALSVLNTKKWLQEERELRDGRWIRLRVEPILDERNNVEFFVEWIRDITESKLAAKKLEQLATTDDLTGLWNRRYFMNAAFQEIERARRYGECFSVLAIDIDHFKLVNDIHGHAAGDMVLEQFAETLKNDLRQSDIPCRVGGEEFSVLLPNTKLEDAYLLAERLREKVAKTPAHYGDSEIVFTVSIGVAAYHQGIDNVDDLLLLADKALYESKETGRNQVVLYDPIR